MKRYSGLNMDAIFDGDIPCPAGVTEVESKLGDEGGASDGVLEDCVSGVDRYLAVFPAELGFVHDLSCVVGGLRL